MKGSGISDILNTIGNLNTAKGLLGNVKGLLNNKEDSDERLVIESDISKQIELEKIKAKDLSEAAKAIFDSVIEITEELNKANHQSYDDISEALGELKDDLKNITDLSKKEKAALKRKISKYQKNIAEEKKQSKAIREELKRIEKSSSLDNWRTNIGAAAFGLFNPLMGGFAVAMAFNLHAKDEEKRRKKILDVKKREEEKIKLEQNKINKEKRKQTLAGEQNTSDELTTEEIIKLERERKDSGVSGGIDLDTSLHQFLGEREAARARPKFEREYDSSDRTDRVRAEDYQQDSLKVDEEQKDVLEEIRDLLKQEREKKPKFESEQKTKKSKSDGLDTGFNPTDLILKGPVMKLLLGGVGLLVGALATGALGKMLFDWVFPNNGKNENTRKESRTGKRKPTATAIKEYTPAEMAEYAQLNEFVHGVENPNNIQGHKDPSKGINFGDISLNWHATKGNKGKTLKETGLGDFMLSNMDIYDKHFKQIDTEKQIGTSEWANSYAAKFTELEKDPSVDMKSRYILETKKYFDKVKSTAKKQGYNVEDPGIRAMLTSQSVQNPTRAVNIFKRGGDVSNMSELQQLEYLHNLGESAGTEKNRLKKELLNAINISESALKEIQQDPEKYQKFKKQLNKYAIKKLYNVTEKPIVQQEQVAKKLEEAKKIEPVIEQHPKYESDLLPKVEKPKITFTESVEPEKYVTPKSEYEKYLNESREKRGLRKVTQDELEKEYNDFLIKENKTENKNTFENIPKDAKSKEEWLKKYNNLQRDQAVHGKTLDLNSEEANTKYKRYIELLIEDEKINGKNNSTEKNILINESKLKFNKPSLFDLNKFNKEPIYKNKIHENQKSKQNIIEKSINKPDKNIKLQHLDKKTKEERYSLYNAKWAHLSEDERNKKITATEKGLDNYLNNNGNSLKEKADGTFVEVKHTPSGLEEVRTISSEEKYNKELIQKTTDEKLNKSINHQQLTKEDSGFKYEKPVSKNPVTNFVADKISEGLGFFGIETKKPDNRISNAIESVTKQKEASQSKPIIVQPPSVNVNVPKQKDSMESYTGDLTVQDPSSAIINALTNLYTHQLTNF